MLNIFSLNNSPAVWFILAFSALVNSAEGFQKSMTHKQDEFRVIEKLPENLPPLPFSGR